MNFAKNKLTFIGLPLVALILVMMLAVSGCSNTPAATTTTTTAPPTTTQATTAALTTAALTTTAQATTTSAAPTTTKASPTATTTAPASPTVPHANNEVLLSSTTSTKDSGLMDVLGPLFESQTHYKLTALYQGSGAAMTTGQQGGADVLLVHAPDSELKFVADGWGINRKLVMHNDFIILGPSNDPAGIKGMTSAADALKKIADTQSKFYSRGDNSGTDQLDKKLWKSIGITVKDKATTNPAWYIEANTGMGALLGVAYNDQAYTISDRATYLANKDKFPLDIMVQGDPALLNVYHVIQVNPDKYPGIINAEGAKAFSDFMINPDTQAIIAKYGIDKYGQPLFYADAGKTEAELGSK